MEISKNWICDLKSSLVVFLVALPLCLGIALASGAPLAAGLLSGIIGGIVVGSLSGSNVSVSGPAAGLTVIVSASIQDLGSFEIFTLAVFISGLIQIVLGIFKAGSIGEYFPTSVIQGMLSAIGLILILKQFPHAIGYDSDFMGDLSFFQKDGENTFSEILLSFEWLHWGAVIISLISLLIIIIWEKINHPFFRLVPGALIAVMVGLILNELVFPPINLNLDATHLVNIPSKMTLLFPNWNELSNLKIYKVAVTIAIVASLESLLSLDAADKLENKGLVSSKNRELFAQGVGNTVAGFLGGLPVTAVIVRTTANVTAGAKSSRSAIMHGIWLLSFVLVFPHLLNKIPLASLAAILLSVGYKLAKPDLFKSMYKKGFNQLIPFVGTILAILFTDLLIGITIGMIIGFFFVIRSNYRQAIVTVSDSEVTLIRFHKDVSFLQKATLSKILQSIKPHTSLVIDSNGAFVDEDICQLIEDFIKRSESKNIKVVLKKSSNDFPRK